MSNFKNDLTEGSVGKQLLKFCVPFLLSNLLQALYNIADTFIVGNFDSSEGVSGVSIGGQVTLLVINLVVGLTVGGTILVAQFIGAKKDSDAHETISTMFTVMIISGIAATVLILVSSDLVLRLMQTPEESFSQAKAYLNICGGGIIFTFLYNGISAVMRGMGDSKHPLMFVAIACGINIVLDIIAVAVFKMSSAGAALATVISQAISVIISIIYLKKHGFLFDFRLKSFRIHRGKLLSLLKLGLPASAQNVIVSLSFIFLTSLVNGYGVDASAAVGIAGKFNSIAILPAIAMSMAVSSMGGQNIGAGLYDRAEKTMVEAIKISYVICGAIFILTQLFPSIIMRIFTPEEPVIAIGKDYLRVFSLDYILVPLLFSFNGLFNGAGHTVFSLFNGMLSSVLLRVPAALLFSTVCGLGVMGVGLGAPTATLGAIISGFIYLKSGRWKENRIQTEKK